MRRIIDRVAVWPRRAVGHTGRRARRVRMSERAASAAAGQRRERRLADGTSGPAAERKGAGATPANSGVTTGEPHRSGGLKCHAGGRRVEAAGGGGGV